SGNRPNTGSPSPGIGLGPSFHDAAANGTSPASTVLASATSSFTTASSIVYSPVAETVMRSVYQSWSSANVPPGFGRTATRGVFSTADISEPVGSVTTSIAGGDAPGTVPPSSATTSGVCAPHATTTASPSTSRPSSVR